MTTPHSRKIVAAVIGFLFSSVLALAAPIKFEIPAQPAPAALKAFVKQSSQQVVFNPAEMEGVNGNEVKGSFEPAEALDVLLKGTGFNATKGKGGIFMVKKVDAPATTGAVRGSLTGEGGKGLPNVLVVIRETSQSAETDKYGVYVFPNVAVGIYVLVASAPGYQTMHITDVQVKAGRELTLGKEDMRKAGEGPLALEPFVVHADTVEQLEKVIVTDTKPKPFSDRNVDLSRGIDDVQPYYIFDAKTIDQSGATNVEDFLKQRLTMNTTALTNAQISGTSSLGASNQGNFSSINLRGLGADKTLVLINGRRVAGVNYIGTVTLQPDLNGVPLSAIERIEVLPSSASGIYGGSAIGGVINVILKKDYVGGEVRVTYDNTWNSDSPSRTLSASYGLGLEGGKTHVMLNTSWSDAQPLLLQDRRGPFDRNLATIARNYPAFLYGSGAVFLGSATNVMNYNGKYSPDLTQFTPDNLALKNGTSLGSGITYVPIGASNSTPSATLIAGLVANAGSWNLDLPASSQSPTGLLQPFGSTPRTKSFQASVSRQMLSMIELFSDFSYNDNSTESVYNPFAGYSRVRANSPINPFTTAVRVRFPDSSTLPDTSQSVSRSFTLGAIAHLPGSWTGEFDYSWSESRYAYNYYGYDRTAMAADLLRGDLNPFVDTQLYPLKLAKYLYPAFYSGGSTLNDFALRGSGPLWPLPWGTPSLTLGLEHRIAGTPNNSLETDYPITITDSTRYIFFGRQQTTNSAYGEMTIPLVKKNWLPMIQTLDLQLSGRSERYSVDTGTPGYAELPNVSNSLSYFSPTLNGAPYFSKASYTSTNGTVGLKYQPISEVTLRASLATAFIPPTPDQLVKNPLVDSYTTTVTDPKAGGSVDVQTISGGNPGLKPQSSKSWNAGVIWEPRWSLLKGLRCNAEYYRIEQDNYIDSLDAQTIVNLESIYSNRVTRDGSGTITLVDTSLANLYKRETEGWDLSADYTIKTGAGTFTLTMAESIILHLKNQYSQTLPEYDAVNFPSENGAAKYKSNATLSWEWRNWTAGWSTRFFSSYKQNGATGGPLSSQYYDGAAAGTSYLLAQGGDTIPSQTYHDLFVGYAFGKHRAENGSRLKAVGSRVLDSLTVQLGLKNIFNKVPPFDAYYIQNYYLSPYGDIRLRCYWLSVKKTF